MPAAPWSYTQIVIRVHVPDCLPLPGCSISNALQFQASRKHLALRGEKNWKFGSSVAPWQGDVKLRLKFLYLNGNEQHLRHQEGIACPRSPHPGTCRDHGQTSCTAECIAELGVGCAMQGYPLSRHHHEIPCLIPASSHGREMLPLHTPSNLQVSKSLPATGQPDLAS